MFSSEGSEVEVETEGSDIRPIAPMSELENLGRPCRSPSLKTLTSTPNIREEPY